MGGPLATWLVLLAAAFAAGALNAAAGGGSFLTLPALVLAGVPPVAANATGTAALLPGYVSSTFALRHELARGGGGGGGPLYRQVAVCAAGGVVGALVLLATPNSTFRAVVPWLLLLATLIFAAGPRLQAWLARSGTPRPGLAAGSLFAVSVYGGYFNGGLGIMLLAQLSLAGMRSLAAMNGYKNLHSSVLTAIAVLVYALGGTVAWPYALGMAVAAVVGGYAGAVLSRNLPAPALRAGIVAVGAVMTAVFFLR